MRPLGHVCTIAALTIGIAGVGRSVCAQVPLTPAGSRTVSQQGAAPAADALFADAAAKEAAVRKVLAAPPLQPTLLKAIRTVIADYENVVRHYPASGYCDDALWRAAMLTRDAFEAFGESRERSTGLRLLRLLSSQYPSSKLAKAAPDQVAWFDAHPARVNTPQAQVAAAAPPAPGSAGRAATTSGVSTTAPVAALAPVSVTADAGAGGTRPSTATRLVGVKGIRRAVMKDLVRVVIELDDEVTFHDERIEGPSRVFVDLAATRANPALIDQTLRFDADTDVVRQIRVGRHQNSVTRIVLEASGVSSYSVYPLYSPFRLVIDCLRAAPQVADTGAPPLSPRPLAEPLALAPLSPAGQPQAAVRAVTEAAPATQAAPARSAAEVPAVVLRAAASAMPAPAVSVEQPLALAAAATAVRPVPEPVAARQMPDARPAAGSTPAPASASAATPATGPAPKAADKNLSGGLSIARQLGLGVSRIVIDPGHGGHDPGAKGAGGTEADLVLDIALRLERLLTKVPGVEVVLTRRDNTFVSLQERTAMANRESADLFLSIHANASSVTAARGIETYFLNFASTQGAAAVAARENATSGQAMGSLQDVVKSIALNSKRDESRDFATYVQREMLASLRSANGTIRDLGVKQAPFVVLIGAEMPSILAEVSFLTNPQEAKLLKGNSYRQKIAQALFEGVRKYQASLKTGLAVAAQQN